MLELYPASAGQVTRALRLGFTVKAALALEPPPSSREASPSGWRSVGWLEPQNNWLGPLPRRRRMRGVESRPAVG